MSAPVDLVERLHGLAVHAEVRRLWPARACAKLVEVEHELLKGAVRRPSSPAACSTELATASTVGRSVCALKPPARPGTSRRRASRRCGTACHAPCELACAEDRQRRLGRAEGRRADCIGSGERRFRHHRRPRAGELRNAVPAITWPALGSACQRPSPGSWRRTE